MLLFPLTKSPAADVFEVWRDTSSFFRHHDGKLFPFHGFLMVSSSLQWMLQLTGLRNHNYLHMSLVRACPHAAIAQESTEHQLHHVVATITLRNILSPPTPNN